MELTRAWVVDSVQTQMVTVGRKRLRTQEVTVVRAVSKVEDTEAECVYFHIPEGGDIPVVGSAVEVNVTFTAPEEDN